MPQTWNRLIYRALVEIGVISAGETVDPVQLEDGLESLQDMLDQWAFEGLLVPALTHYDHTVTGRAKQVYTISADVSQAPDIVGDPPPTIEALSYRRQGITEPSPLVQTSYIVWAEGQSSVSTWPSQYYYEKEYPVARIYFDALTLPGDFFRLSGRAYLTGDSLVGTEVHNLPRGYPRAVKYNLAVDIAASFGVKGGLSPTTIYLARMTKNNIRARNIGSLTFRLDTAVVRKDSGALRRGRGSWGW